jgi:hypothetical protein
MRGATVELPSKAKNKLDELVLARDLALDAARSVNAKLQALPADVDQRFRQKLADEHNRQQTKFGVLSQVVSRCNQWCFELRLGPGSSLQLAPATALKPGETVATVRTQIADCTKEIASVRTAPLARASQRAAINNYLSHLARRSGPKVGFDAQGNARIGWVEDMATMDGVLGLLVFVLGADKVAAAFAREHTESEPMGALTPQERDAQIVRLTADLLLLERKEEALIEKASEAGQEVLRRPASPMAVLGLVIVKAQSAAA